MQATHFDRQEDRQRIEELDIVKALGIICMVAGHSDAPFTHFIYLFHMAVFFMAAGFFFKDETSNDFRCDVNDKQKYSSKKISSLSLLSVLSRASSCAHVFCLPKSKSEQIPYKSVVSSLCRCAIKSTRMRAFFVPRRGFHRPMQAKPSPLFLISQVVLNHAAVKTPVNRTLSAPP